MTNGEKIIEIFPDINIYEHGSTYSINNEYNFNASWWNAEYQEPTTKNDLGVNCIDKTELLKAMNTYDKFGNDPDEGLISLRTPALRDRYVLYVKYDDMVNCVKGMSSITPIRPKGHWIDRWDKVLLCEDKNCSICGYLAQTKHNYCPNCGADMREVEKCQN